MVRAGVDQLPDFLRQVVILAYYQGLKYKDIAGILGIPVGTVKSRLHTALAKLQRSLVHNNGLARLSAKVKRRIRKRITMLQRHLDENLIGYLLGALDGHSMAQVEAQIQATRNCTADWNSFSLPWNRWQPTRLKSHSSQGFGRSHHRQGGGVLLSESFPRAGNRCPFHAPAFLVATAPDVIVAASLLLFTVRADFACSVTLTRSQFWAGQRSMPG